MYERLYSSRDTIRQYYVNILCTTLKNQMVVLGNLPKIIYSTSLRYTIPSIHTELKLMQLSSKVLQFDRLIFKKKIVLK